MKNIIFWGGTGQSIVLEEFLKPQGYNTIAVYDRDINVVSPFSSVPIFHDHLAFYNYLQDFAEVNYVVAIAGGNGRDRLEVHQTLKNRNLIPVTSVHPSAIIASDAVIGEGSQVLAGSIVCSRVKLGKCVIVNTAATIDHGCIISNGCHLAPGTHLAGDIFVGENTFIGIGSSVCPRVKIGSNVIIGAGSMVIKDIPDNSVAYGVPAKVIRNVEFEGNL